MGRSASPPGQPPGCEGQWVRSEQVTRYSSCSVPVHRHGCPRWTQSEPGLERDRLFLEAGQSHPCNRWEGQRGTQLGYCLPPLLSG